MEELLKMLENVEWATLNVAIKEKYNCLLIPEEKWQSVTGELFRLVGEDNWDEEWDY
jgi:hypothetical protein